LGAAAPLARPQGTEPPSPDEANSDQSAPLAAKRDERIPSKNEAYNLARAGEGRLGVRLGNDMSFRVTGN
jgi:hypothetical protein